MRIFKIINCLWNKTNNYVIFKLIVVDHFLSLDKVKELKNYFYQFIDNEKHLH